MESITLKVRGMTCSGCIASVQRVLHGLAGVEHADVTLAEGGKATVRYEPGRTTPADMASAIEDAGYEIER
jgi:copper chaperone